MLKFFKEIINIFGEAAENKLMFNASDMIKQLASEEEKLLQLQTQNLKQVIQKPPPKIDIASILSKYVSTDLNKEAYKFIKLEPSLSCSEASIQP